MKLRSLYIFAQSLSQEQWNTEVYIYASRSRSLRRERVNLAPSRLQTPWSRIAPLAMHLVQTVCNRLVMPWSDKQGRGANHGLPIPAKSLLPCLALPISLHLPCPAMADTIPSQYLEMYWLSYTVSEAKWRDETRCVYAMTAMRLIKNSKCLQKKHLDH